MSDEELREIAQDFRDGMLGERSSLMMCAAVSWPLASLLNGLYEIACEAVEFDAGECNHVYIRLDDGRALDPTLDQFNHWFPWKNYPPVFVGTVSEYEKMWGISHD